MVSDAYENAYDTAILVSGDGDFVPVIKKMKYLGKKIELWAFEYSLAKILIDEVGEEFIFLIDDFLEELKI